MDPPVHSDGQQCVGGHVERDGAQVVCGGAEQQAVLPRQLLHHVVVQQEGTAHDRHQHVRHGQVGDQQVGQILGSNEKTAREMRLNFGIRPWVKQVSITGLFYVDVR